MTLSRRDFLKLSGLVATGVSLSACGPTIYQRLSGNTPLSAWSSLTASDFRALSRLTFGPRTDERSRLGQIGLQAWVEEQLAPSLIDDFNCSLRLQSFDTLSMQAHELVDMSSQLLGNLDRNTVPDELRQATLVRQVYSRRQLYESMVEFWTDHFNIATARGDCFYLKTVDDREVIRKNALGSFRDLVFASAHSPAMLVYLDNQANHKGAPNENYARELMELHTLSVSNGYTQQDVMELARCLTGWTVKEHFWTGDFTFDPGVHDDGDKSVLGLTLHNAGESEAEAVLEKLINHPNTANFIATKLARRFLSDPPPAAIVQRAAAVFTQSHGDILSVLRVILLDGLGQTEPKYKRPVTYTVSALRMLDADTDGGAALQDYLMRMGQTYFGWPSPDGYPDRDNAWDGNLLPRWQFAFGLVRGEIPNTKFDMKNIVGTSGAKNLTDKIDAISSLLLGAPFEATKRDELIAAVGSAGANEEETISVVTAGLLASPAFQWR
jgi:Protein of unknown function (DUF1800)/TAT (twin-arginine translocation) pathway signal sequence